jgi:acetyl-CoA carboxylase biotin carboxyl carrier protein
MALTYDEITEILKIIDSSSCDEIVLETGDVKLVVRRRGTAGAPTSAWPESPSAAASGAGTSAAPGLSPAKTEAPIAEGQHALRAPMVGTFYRAPSPDAPPFVEIGAPIEKGDPVCVIEVMKLFTTIHAERGGTIAEIRAENAALVEYGQILFVIDPG